MSQHTPTPISIDSRTLRLLNNRRKPVTAKELEFIMHAVNSHEALLEAAKIGKRMAELLEEASDSTMTDDFKDDLKTIRKAIAQGETRP